MLKIVFVFAIAFLLQAGASFVQMKYFAKEFARLRKEGKVVCGRQAGGFHAGAIVMFVIDDDGIIKQARKLEGVTCLARIKDLNGFEGKYVGQLTGEEIPKTHKNLRKAVRDAALTYCRYVSGEEFEVPPSPFQKAGRSVAGLMQHKKVLQ